MKILAISDLHGQIDVLDTVPECDVLIIAGDSFPYEQHDLAFQERWAKQDFAEKLHSLEQRAKHIIGIGGNHDYALQDHRIANKLPWTYLKDSEVTIEGVKFYGTPWVPNLPRWAFHASDTAMYHCYGAIPEDTDVVISHGPPFGIADLSSERFGKQRCGHPAVNEMLDRVRPQLFVCGHIHESHGHHQFVGGELLVSKWVPVVNVAYLDDYYRPAYGWEDVSRYVQAARED